MNFNFNDIVMQEALHNDPEFLVIVGKQKTGKSTILAELSRKHNFLILDTQSGYNQRVSKKIDLIGIDYPMDMKWIEGYRKLTEEREIALKAGDRATIDEIDERLKKAKYWEHRKRPENTAKNSVVLKDLLEFYETNEFPYDGIIIDLMSHFDEWLEEYMMREHCRNNPDHIISKKGKPAKDGKSVVKELTSEFGSPGYQLIKDGFRDLMVELKKKYKRIIGVFHIADKYLKESDKIYEIDPKKLNIRGSLSDFILSEADAACWISKDDDNVCTLNFNSNKSLIDARCPHLYNQDIIISEYKITIPENSDEKEKTKIIEAARKKYPNLVDCHWERVFTYLA